MIRVLGAWPVPAVLLLSFLAACGHPGAAPAESLETVGLIIAGHSLTAEVAATPEQQARGLMFRESMPANHGMLFPFPEPRTASFWMRNTPLPLSIAYLDTRGVILEIHDMKPFDERSIRSASGRVAYALEVHQGWFRRHGITPGDRVLGLPPTRSP